MEWFFRRPAEPSLPSDPSLPETFIITSKDEKAGTVTIHCDNMAAGGTTIRCFLSPLDAMIEASRLAKPGEPLSVISVREIDRAAAKEPHPVFPIGCVHMAWLARQGRLLVRPIGTPEALAEPFRCQSCRGRLRFEVARSTLDEIDTIYQRAGLYAWREAAANIRRWSEAERQEAVRIALRDMPVMQQDGTSYDQYALFDPEFRQWHFVPRDA